jgi:hypothetical protein
MKPQMMVALRPLYLPGIDSAMVKYHWAVIYILMQ